MYINKKLFNNIAEAEVFTGDCKELIGKDLSFGNLKPKLGQKIRELIGLINVYCGEGVHPHLYKQHSEDIRDIAKYLICVILSLINSGYSNETILRGFIKSLSMLHRTAELDLEGNNPAVTCENYKVELEEVLRDFKAAFPAYFHEITPNPTPITCPEVVNEGWIRDHLNQYDEIKGQVLEIVIAILLGLSAAIAAALAAAALIGPAALASAIATATAAIQSALAWLIGQQAAATVAAGIVAAISTKCIADDTEIEVKEPTEVCCFEGEIIDDVPGGENGCEEIGGTWGYPEDTECGPYQQGK